MIIWAQLIENVLDVQQLPSTDGSNLPFSAKSETKRPSDESGGLAAPDVCLKPVFVFSSLWSVFLNAAATLEANGPKQLVSYQPAHLNGCC